MLLKVLVLLISVSIVGIAFVAYHPLPEGIGDPYKVQFLIGVIKIFRAYVSIKL